MGNIDVAVHSHKDIPTDLPNGITICSVMERGNPFDVLVVRKNTDFLNNKDHAGLIATSSNRRKSQWIDRYENTIPATLEVMSKHVLKAERKQVGRSYFLLPLD